MSRKRKQSRPVRRATRPTVKGYARGGVVHATSMTIHGPGGLVTWSMDPVRPSPEERWDVPPTEVLRGSVGSGITWVAERVRRGAMVPRGEVQMVRYECTITVVEQVRRGGWVGMQDGLTIGPFEVLHRPRDGDIALGAKVLAMAVAQPEWDAYTWKVENEGW